MSPDGCFLSFLPGSVTGLDRDEVRLRPEVGRGGNERNERESGCSKVLHLRLHSEDQSKRNRWNQRGPCNASDLTGHRRSIQVAVTLSTCTRPATLRGSAGPTSI